MKFFTYRLPVLLAFSLLSSIACFAVPSFYRTYVAVDVGFGPEFYQVTGTPDGVSPQFSDLVDNIDTSIPFNLLGGEIQSGESGATVIDAARMFWRVYEAGDVPGAYSLINMPLCCDETGTDCDFGGQCVDPGLPAELRRLFREDGLSIDVLSGQYVGEFVFEFYFEVESSGTLELLTEGSSGTPYQHPYCRMFESFSDGDFTNNVIWSGDAANWTVVFNSDVAAGATASNTLRLNVASGAGTQYLSTAYSTWGDEQQWTFWLGRRAQSYTALNTVAIWLYADQFNLEAANINGYRILIGDDTGGDELFLQRVVSGVAANVIGSTAIPNALTDIGVGVRIERDQFGTWSLFTTTLPAVNGQGSVATDCVDAALSHGSNIDNTFNLTGLLSTGYVGPVVVHSAGATSRVAVELDQFGIRVSPAPPVTGCTDPTACNFNPFANTDDGSCTYPGCTDIAACNFVPLADCDDGSCTYPGCTDVLACNYNPAAGCDDGSCLSVTYIEQFTDGNFTASPVWSGDTGNWLVVANSDAAAGATGSQTLRLNSPLVAATDHLSTPITTWDDAQEWNFWLGRRGQALTAANEVFIWLYADEANLESGTINGYRLNLGDDSGVDELRLQRVNAGVATTIMSAAGGIPNALTDIGFNIRVTRSWDGNWELFTDTLPVANGTGAVANNCVVAAISQGTTSDNSIVPGGTGFIGIACEHSSGATAIISTELDDIGLTTSIVVVGCTDPAALNYDPFAVVDDGSCTYPLYDLVISEIHYNPDDAGGFPDINYEFLEIYNNDVVAVNLENYELANAVTFTFPAATVLNPGEYLVVAIDAASYAVLTCDIFQWSGQLNNTGETIELYDNFGQLVDLVTYSNSAPWPTGAAGSGPSAELLDVDVDNNDGSNWDAQTINGTACGPILTLQGCTDPSATNYDPSATVWDGSCTYGPVTVVINEVYYNPCSTQGTDEIYEFMELYNADPVNVIDLSGWQVLGIEVTFAPGTSIAPGEYIVLAKTPATYSGNGYQVFGFGTPGSGLLNTGEAISLVDDLSNVVDYVLYEPAAPWAESANGSCTSLELTNPNSDNYDPANWYGSYVAFGTPGVVNSLLFSCSDCGGGSFVVTPFSDDFEDGLLNGWQLDGPADWNASGVSVNGVFSLKHENAGSGTSYASSPVSCTALEGVCTTWRFQSRYDFTPTSSDRFVYFLASNDADLSSAGISGLAVGLNFGTVNNLITLYEVASGVYTELMAYPVEISSGVLVSAEVVLSEAGDIMLSVDADGGFDELLNAQVSAVGTSFSSEVGNTGVLFDFTASSGSNLWVDDISIARCATNTYYYSQAGGNFEDPIWSTIPVGPSVSVVSDEYTTFHIQATHAVSLNQTERASDMNIDPSGTLSLNGNDLYIHGDLNVSAAGNYAGYPGHTYLTCGGAQIIFPAGSTIFGDVTLDNSAGASLSGPGQAMLRGVYHGESGVFNTGTDQLILDANGTYAGFIGELQAGSSVTGSVTIRTYVPAAPVWNGTSPTTGNGYVTLTTQTQNQVIEDWDDDILITGFAGSDLPTYYFQSMHTYDETVLGQRALGFTVPSSTSDPLIPWTGYSTYVLQGAQTIDNSGDIFQSAQTIPLTRTPSLGGTHDGWNQVGNSYPAPIDFDAMYAFTDPIPLDGNDAPSFFYTFDQQINGYRVWNTLLQTGNGSRYIPRGQGIFVWAQNNFLNYQLHEGLKYTEVGAPVSIERNAEGHPLISVKMQNGEMADEAFIVWHQMGTDEMQPGLDAPKFGGSFGVSTDAGDEKLSMSALSNDFNNITIPVRVEVSEEWALGVYTISFPEVENLPEGICLTIEDVLTGEITALDENTTFEIEVTGIMDEVRYYINVIKPIEYLVNDASCYNLADAGISLESIAGNDWNIWLMDQYGQTVLNTVSNGSIETMTNLASGTYILVLSGGIEACGTMTYNIVVDQPAQELVSILSEAAECGTAVGAITVNPENITSYDLTVSDANAQVVTSVVEASGPMTITDLPAGNYTVTHSAACTSESVIIDLTDPNSVLSNFMVSNTQPELQNGQVTIEFINQSVNAVSNLWTINEEEVSELIGFNHVFTLAGSYVIALHASNEMCEDVKEFVLEVSSGNAVSELSANQITLTQMGNAVAIGSGSVVSGSRAELYDNHGKLVHSESFNLNVGQTMMELPASLAAGIYNLRVLTAEQSLELKVIR